MTRVTATVGFVSSSDAADALPIRPAATVLVLAERPDLHVLMLERNPESVFAPSQWVFPGGAVDDHDATPEADATVAGRTDAEASAILGLDRGGIAYWVAALRETYEEAGVLLSPEPLPPSVPSEVFGRWRREVNAGKRSFVEMVRSLGVRLDGAGVHYVSRWVTPVGPPRRFDARFFVTAMPDGQVPAHDDDEAVAHRWIRPTDALEANRRSELAMFSPTVGVLRRLAEFATVAEAIAAAASSTAADDEMIRIRSGVEGPERVAFPADRDYEQAFDRVEDGMVRWRRG